jgi:dTDP-4-amino-4,6-dideoxygalactose transaminase
MGSKPSRVTIPFSAPAILGTERAYIDEVLQRGRFSGNREFGSRCADWLVQRFGSVGAFVTPSATHALEMAALLLNLGEGDEVITASFGFSSTANAFALRGARLVFIDARPDTMNLDERLLEAAITERTRVIVVTHYAGVACEMDTIVEIARRHGVSVIEDAAQAILSRYRDRYCGTLGRLACFSFHESKNVHCGEGGALLVNDPALVPRAEIIQEKGTNRQQLFRGEVDFYTWMDLGSSYLLSELAAAFLLAQIEGAEGINADRMRQWNRYAEMLAGLAGAGRIELPTVPAECVHNAHCFYLKAANREEREALIVALESQGIRSVFHYVPLHSSPAGRRYGRFHGEDRWTTRESDRLLRLPLYHAMPTDAVERVVEAVCKFYDTAPSRAA